MGTTADKSRGSAMRVAVIGGGPSGAFFTYCLQERARETGERVEVTVFEPKRFEKRGALHCNYCQGVISAGLVRAMEKIGLKIPEKVIRAQITSYRMVTREGELTLPAPRNQHIYTVFRGHGPVDMEAGRISFDQFLLDRATAGGASLLPVAVDDIEMTGGGDGPVRIVGTDGGSYTADVVIGAFGVNSALGESFEKLGFGYHRPRTDSALQAEFRTAQALSGADGASAEIKIFSLGLHPIRFGVITPKAEHLTVSLIGPDLDPGHLMRFMEHPLVRRALPDDLEHTVPRCRCMPLMPISDGGSLAGERVIVIGDAAVSRYYKNGIESALHSAELAVEALLRYGPLDRENICRSYTRRVKKMFNPDNKLGRRLFRVHDFINRRPVAVRALLDIARGEFGFTGHSRSRMRWILWNMFTGDASYKTIFIKCLDPLLVVRVFQGMLRVISRRK